MPAQKAIEAVCQVRVKPKSRQERVMREGGQLLIETRAPAVEGQANAAVIGAVATALGVRPRQVRIIRGETARIKLLAIRELTPEELADRIAALAEAER